MAAPSEPLIQPPRKPRDEAALLLTVVAEVEHALMVQYLYAAYSVRYDLENHAHQGAARSLHLRLLQIAREEMGHLITVQNLLLLVGAPLNLRREDSPSASTVTAPSGAGSTENSSSTCTGSIALFSRWVDRGMKA